MLPTTSIISPLDWVVLRIQDDGLSSALGWVSIACWVVVYTPQIYENYKRQSGEGLELGFVVAWMLGDLCNLTGAVMAGLLPTMIILAAYYTVCDLVLLLQIFYYRRKRSLRAIAPRDSEVVPLLRTSDSDVKLKRVESEVLREVLRYVLLMIFVVATGLIAWRISQEHEAGGPKHREDEGSVIEWKSQVIGWMSALLYLGARFPQIIKNFETKCEGLSPALFMFAIVGNVTYVLSICTKSMDMEHFIANSSWLAGSGLTIFLDMFVLGQFFYFRGVADEGDEASRE